MKNKNKFFKNHLNKLLHSLLFFCCISFPNFIFSQSLSKKQPQLDSLHIIFSKDSAHTYRFKKVRPLFSIDQRQSWIKNERGEKRIPIAINGFHTGIILYEKHNIGFGLYSMSSASKKPIQIVDKNNIIRYQELSMSYLTLFYEYNIFNMRYFKMNLPLEIGLGGYDYFLKDETRTQLLWQEKGPVRISGGGVEIVLKPLRWVGLKGMLGYRIVVFNKKSNLNLSGVYYSYGLWIDLRQIYRDVKFYGFSKPKYRKKINSILASEG